MPDVNDATNETEQGAAAQPADGEALPGFAEAMAGGGLPPGFDGEAEETEAVDQKPDDGAPPEESEPKEAEDEQEQKPDTSEADDGDDDDGEESGDAEQAVNFDGFSDAQKTTWERLFKDGRVTADEVERARLESMFQSAFTKKTMDLAEKRKAFDKEMEDRREDLSLLDRIRKDDRLHNAWLRMQSGDLGEDPDDGDDLIDAKRANEIVDKRIEAREAERRQRTEREQRTYESRQNDIREAMQESMQTLGIDQSALVSYLEAEEAALPAGVDPVLHFSAADLQARVALRHEAAKARAEADSLKKKLSKRTSQEARAAKQSLPPARRVAQPPVDDDPMRKTAADLGLDQQWSNVQGFGFREAR